MSAEQLQAVMRLSSMKPYAAKDLLHYYAESYARDISQAQDVDQEEAQRIAQKWLLPFLSAETLPENELFFDLINRENQVVGKVWLTHRSDNILFITYLEIDEDQRGKGYAQQAMSEIETFAKGRDVKQLWLHVFAHNQAAQHVYEKSGYTCSGIQMFKKI